MIYKFPYTDLYSLNLDWMIQAMKEMQSIVEPLDRVVNSVNNMTGDVVITKAFLLNILESMVSKFNGRAGDVTLTAADVNNTLIDITWTSDPGDVIGDIQQNVLDQMYAAGKRVLIFVNNQGMPDTIYFLTLVGDVVTPQIYSPTAALAGVASFNGQTGAVTATGSDLDTANDNDTPISESIENLQSAVDQQSQQIDEKTNLTNIAPVENGTTATQNYKVNDLIIIDGLLYKVTTPIQSGETFVTGTNISQTNIDSVISVLGSETVQFTITSSSDSLLSGGLYKVGKIVIVNFTMTTTRTSPNSPGIAYVPLTEMRPKVDSALNAIDITSGITASIDAAIPCGIGTEGRIFIKSLTETHIYAVTGVYIIN